MELKGSRWSMNKRRKTYNPWRIIILVGLIAVGLYVNFVIVPVTPPLFVPTPTATRSVQSYITEAQSLSGEGKFVQAIDAYKVAIQINPKDATIYVAMAQLEIYTGNFDAAIEHAGNALVISDTNALAYAVRGYALGNQGNWLEASAALKKAMDLEPSNAIPFAYYTEVLLMEIDAGEDQPGTLDDAIAASQTAVELGPDLLETHRARGLLLEATQNYEEAVAEFEAAIKINPNIADLHLALGRNYRALSLLDQAVEEFNRAYSLNPTDPMPNLLISRTWATIGEYSRAVQAARTALKDAPTDPYMYGNLGVMLYRNKQYEEALPMLRLAVRGGVTDNGTEITGLPLNYGRVAEYYYVYGLAQARVGDCGEVLQVARLLRQGVPDDTVATDNADAMELICEERANGTATPTPTTTAKNAETTPTP